MEAAGTVGVVHLALHSDQQGLITRWKTRLKAYIDPGLHTRYAQFRHACLEPSCTQTFRHTLTQATLDVDTAQCHVQHPVSRHCSAFSVRHAVVQSVSALLVLQTATWDISLHKWADRLRATCSVYMLTVVDYS